MALLGLAWSGRRGAPTVERGGKHAVVNKLVTHLTTTAPPKVDARREEDPSFRPFARRGDQAGFSGGGGGDATTSTSNDRVKDGDGGARSRSTAVIDDEQDALQQHPVSRLEPVLIEADEASARRLRRDDDVFEAEDGRHEKESKNGAHPAKSGHQHHHRRRHHRLRGFKATGPKQQQQQHDDEEEEEEEERDGEQNTVGFFLQMAHEPKASLEVVKSVREHFPDAPLTVVSDAGWDCAAMCEKYSCRFRREAKAAGRRRPYTPFRPPLRS